jgi:MFS family permease
MSAVLVPFFGVIVDKYGLRATFLLMCSLAIMGVHLTLGLTMLSPVYPLIFLGLSYSLYGVAIWPSVATIVQHAELKLAEREEFPPKLLGTAYGISTSALNTALTIMPVIAAEIRVAGESFLPVELFFAALAGTGALASLILWKLDSLNDGVLQKPEMQQPEIYKSPLRSETESEYDQDHWRTIDSFTGDREWKPLLSSFGYGKDEDRKND